MKLFLGNLSAIRKLYIVVGGGLIGLALILFFLIKPLGEDLTLLHGQLVEQQQVLDRLRLEELSAKIAKSDFSRIGNRAKEIQDLFPPREELVIFIERLESIASTFQSDFSIVITDAQEIEEKSTTPLAPYSIVPGLKEIEVIPYNILLEGDFESVIKFLQTLENQAFYSEIGAMSLRSGVNQGSTTEDRSVGRSGLVEANIQAAFYALAEE
jgi:hypothetical protein